VAGVHVHWSYFRATTGILAFSAFYEVIEMVVAELVAPDLGAAGPSMAISKESVAGISTTKALSASSLMNGMSEHPVVDEPDHPVCSLGVHPKSRDPHETGR
jgi:hypothetical protein